jgi:hypothetical protein
MMRTPARYRGYTRPKSSYWLDYCFCRSAQRTAQPSAVHSALAQFSLLEFGVCYRLYTKRTPLPLLHGYLNNTRKKMIYKSKGALYSFHKAKAKAPSSFLVFLIVIINYQ